MSIGKAVYAILTTAAPVSALIGTRVFPDRARLRLPGVADPFPQVCYSDEPEEDNLTFDDHGNGEGTLTVACVARSGDAARDLDTKVKAELDDLDEAMYGGVRVMGMWATGGDNKPEAVDGEEDEIWYVCERTYRYMTR